LRRPGEDALLPGADWSLVRTLRIGLAGRARIRTLRIFLEIPVVVWPVTVRGCEHPLLGGYLAIVCIHDFCSQIDGGPVGSCRDGMPGADVDDMEIEPRLLLFRLHDYHTERRPNPLGRMAAGPEVARGGAHRDVEALREPALGLEHVTVLAVLPSQTRLEEILPPLEERLPLLPGYA